VDVNPAKVEIVNRVSGPIVESGMSELVKEMFNSQRLRATTYTQEAIDNSEYRWFAWERPATPMAFGSELR